MSTKGAIFFAYNNDKIDYVKLSVLAASSVKKHLQLPCTLITDKKINESIFDTVIVEKKEKGKNVRTFYDTENNNFLAQFNNLNKHKVFELSPYDQTILFDVDFLVNNAILNLAFDVNSPIQLYKNAQTLKNTEPEHALDRQLNIDGMSLYWSTVIYFDKSSMSKMFFNIWEYVKNNYDYFQLLCNFPKGLYRTDYAVSIAMHILKGYSEYSDDLFSELPASPMKYMAYKDDIINVDKHGITFLVSNNEKNYLTYSTEENLHIMNKMSMFRHFNNLLKLYE